MQMCDQLLSPSALHPTLTERASGTLQIESWVGPVAGLEAMAKRKILASTGNRTPVVDPVIY
jgi:hypothetical protein